MIWIIIVLLLFALLLLWFCVEQKLLLLRRKTISLARLPQQWDGLRILQITDLHHRQMGQDNCRIVRCAQKEKPDYIVLTGDLVSRDMDDFASIGRFLQNLRSVAPVYLCPGNHELDLPPEVQQQLYHTIRESGCKLLSDETVTLSQTQTTAPLYLCGAALSPRIYRDENHSFRHLEPYPPEKLHQALGTPEGCTILLAHNPLLLDSYADWGADLVLCGHMHGGLIRLPFVGGVLSPERRFFPRYDKGLYQKKNTKMYVSGGIGKPRLGNPPEINLLVLRAKNTAR